MSSIDDKIRDNAIAIKGNEVNITSIKEQLSDHSVCNKEELSKAEYKITKNVEDINDVRSSLTLIAQEVKELIILKNNINARVWKTIVTLIILAVLTGIAQYGNSITKIISLFK